MSCDCSHRDILEEQLTPPHASDLYSDDNASSATFDRFAIIDQAVAMTVGPIRTGPRRTGTTVSTLPYQAPKSVTADLVLSKLRERLPMLSQAEAVEEILRHQSEALDGLELKEDHVIRLAQILEECNYGEKAPCVAGLPLNSNFWRKAINARATWEKKRSLAETTQAAFPSNVFAYYQWHDLGQTGTQCLSSIAKICKQISPHDKDKAWQVAVVEFNRQMLRREKAIRLLRLTRPYIGQLIGEHHAMSKILDAHSPLEAQDFNNTWEIVRKWPRGKAAHSAWEWSQQETIAYMQDHNLGFDKHGVIVPGGGQLDDKLLELYLCSVPEASDATRSHNRLKTSDSCNPMIAASSPVNKSHDHAQFLTAGPSSLQPNRIPRSLLNPEDATLPTEPEGECQDNGQLNGQLKRSGVIETARPRSPGLSRHTFSNHIPRSPRRQEASTDEVSPAEGRVSPSCSTNHDDDESPIWSNVQRKILEAVELVRTSDTDVDDAKRQEIESLLRTALEALEQR